MRTPLLIIAVILSLTALVACEDGEEELAPVTATPVASASSPVFGTPSPVTATPLPAPGGWNTYAEPTLGFALAHPPDLMAENLPQASGNAFVRFEATADAARGFAVTLWANPTGLSLDDWISQSTACLPETVKPVVIADETGRFCSAVFVDSNRGFAAVVARDSTVFYITFGKLGDQEIADILASFRFVK